MTRFLAGLLCLLFAALSPPAGATTVSGGRYGEVQLIEPAGAMRGLVLLFSRRSGWSDADQTAADKLAADGVLVVGIDTGRYLAALADVHEACHLVVGDAEGLSHQLQRARRSAVYFTPILAGTGEGGAIAEKILSVAADNTIGGAVSLDPASDLDPRLNSCPLDPTILHDPGLPGFWSVGRTSDLVPAVHDLIAGVRQAGAKVTVEKFAGNATEASMLFALAEPHLGARAPDEEDVADLPLVESRAATPSTMLAVIISGDGGWRDIDLTIASDLQQAGVSVVGIDALRYFWSYKTPEQTAHDVARVIRVYAARWHAKSVALIGYSFGADVMPFVYNRLPQHEREMVKLLSLLGFEPGADFEIRVSGWLGLPPSSAALPVQPEIEKVPPALVQCFYGADESDSVCPSLGRLGMAVVRTAGSHHFDGDYGHLSHIILEGWRRRMMLG